MIQRQHAAARYKTLAAAWMLIGCLLGVHTSAAADRLVVMDVALAEIVVALGGASRIVGSVSGVEHLPELAGAGRLEGFRQTSAEPILALSPDRILVGQSRILPQTLTQLKAAGIVIDELGNEASEAGLEQRIRKIGMILDKTAAAESLINDFRARMKSAKSRISQTTTRPRAIFILAGGGRPTVVGGRGTSVAALLEMAGAKNVADAFDGFRAMSQEALLLAAPEVILTNEEGMLPSSGIPVVLTAPGAAATPAGQNRQVITLPARYLQGIGLSTPEGMLLLAHKLHPDLQ